LVWTPAAKGNHEIFESIISPGKTLILASWRDLTAANDLAPHAFAGATNLRHRRIRVIRDYGMSDRREAPQYFDPATRRNRQAAE
jgi:hypothetical protein